MSDVQKVISDVAALTNREGKYLTFVLGGEQYGLEILKVQEIMGMMDVTRVPRAPGFVRGVINLRGKVIPVMELRTKFAMDTIEDTEKTCIIVVQVKQEGTVVTMGIIVDEVSEVLDIRGEQIEPSPEFGSGVNTDFILGMGKAAGRVTILLDISKVLVGTDVTAMASMA